ncbi:MAG: Gfo/Idh/MocA family oxidoreductase, partial [Actinobacteria bacterium]|nr:Gfo/Idh/MocA family oxidoreductase [Actinomycetota bacterium]
MRIGLIAGGQATDLHLRAMAHAGGFAVVAVAHPVAAARHDLARRLNCPAFDSAATLLDAAGLDGVVVAS